MPDNSAVKHTARAALKKIWPSAIAVSFIPLTAFAAVYYFGCLLNSVFGKALSFVPFAVALFSGLAIAAPLVLGALRWFWRTTGGANDGILSVFKYFESKREYLHAVSFTAAYVCRLLVSALLSFLPYIITFVIGSGSISTFLSVPEKWNMYVYVANRFFMVLGVIVFIIAAARYYASPVLFVAGDMHPLEAITLSRLLSRHTIGSFYVLIVGFCGWILLSFLGVTMFYTLPYMTAAYIVHCRFAVYYYNRTQDLADGTDFSVYRSTF